MNPVHALLCLAVCATLANAQIKRVTFDDAPVGAPPTGWTLTKTGKGSPVWRVEADASAPSQPNVLKQSTISPLARNETPGDRRDCDGDSVASPVVCAAAVDHG